MNLKKKIRVYLRALEIDDHLQIHKWRSDEEIKQKFSSFPLFTSTANEKNWVESKIFDKTSVSCAICVIENGEFIGCNFISLVDHHNRSGFVSAFIGEKNYLGNGYGTDALILLLKYAFLDRGFERLWAKVIEGNDGALKNLLKAGFQKEGVLRKSCFRNGMFVNEIIMGILKEDFLPVLEGYEL